MPDDEQLQEWTPPRGKGFKVIAWGLIVLIVLSAVATLLVGLFT